MKRLLFCVCLVAAAQAQATTIIPASVRGGVLENGQWGTGYSGTAAGNYLTGYFDYEEMEVRSLFVFDLTGVTGPISTASFQVFLPGQGYASQHETETFRLYDYLLNPAMVGPAAPGVAAFGDAGSGASYGEITVSEGDMNLLLTISLNAAGITAVNNSLGGLFAVGGRLATLSDGNSEETIFGDSADATVQLVVDGERGIGQVPEPSSLVLLGAGLAWLAWRRRAA